MTRGHPGYGGDSSAVQDQLKHVQQIQASSALVLPFVVMGVSSPGVMLHLIMIVVRAKPAEQLAVSLWRC